MLLGIAEMNISITSLFGYYELVWIGPWLKNYNRSQWADDRRGNGNYLTTALWFYWEDYRKPISP